MKAVFKIIIYIFSFALGYLFILLFLALLMGNIGIIEKFISGEGINVFLKTLNHAVLILWLFILIYFGRIKKENKSWRDFGFNKTGYIKLFFLGLLLGLVIIIIYQIFLIIFNLAKINCRPTVPEICSNPYIFVIKVLFLSLLTAFLEELVFRGLFYDILRERFKIWQVIVILSLIFAGFHIYKGILLFIGLFICGIVLAYGRYYFNSIEFSIGLHAGWIILIQYITGFGLIQIKEGIPLWLSGYGYNPSSGIIGLCFTLIAIPAVRFFSKYKLK